MTDIYRPYAHFAPRAGWMNDPNGLIRVDGVWHLFFQHDPKSVTNGPMHWGHATSLDLVHWSEKRVALSPTELGTCFSGSAVETGDGEIKLFYTAHNHTPEGQDHQVQCLVHADRNLAWFTSEPSNPVVPNPGRIAFRDPKVIWHSDSAQWVMLVTEGQSIAFHVSRDLRSWKHVSSFGEGHGRHSDGPWECPDIVPLKAPDGRTMWILIAGLNPGGYAHGSGTQYFVGDFDGTRFSNRNDAALELWLDYGRDYYAAQTFFERGGTESPVALAWASNWAYARQTPTHEFRGSMSLPRELSLVETRKGLRVAARVPRFVREALTKDERPGLSIHDFVESLDEGEELTITLFGEEEPHFVVCRDSSEKGTIRTRRGSVAGMDHFAHDYSVEFEWPQGGALRGSLFLDRGLAELCLNDGLIWVTNLHFPVDVQAPPVHKRQRALQHA
ncbi:MAG TPA: glycoside hydrolase family 32 protein [Devosia sp.]|jgi:fructan beta-fructosidase|uniref:glycoside hydrolase family 32 protein n=1 Tax=Devosia sp. TaxID=1871048 RepID=UPI002F91EE83